MELGGQLKLRRGEPRPLQRRTRTTDMIPVRLDGNRIVADHGLTLVDNVDEFAFVNELESIDGGLVLGFRGRHGTPTHMEDIALGQVCTLAVKWQVMYIASMSLLRPFHRLWG